VVNIEDFEEKGEILGDGDNFSFESFSATVHVLKIHIQKVYSVVHKITLS
jgi:hypothetical protein